MNAIILPITSLDEAKSRHATHLSREQRKSLARAMLRDVSRQLQQLRRQCLIVLASPDWEMVEFALEQGWEAIHEDRPGSESESVDRASALLERRGVTQALRIPADIPLLRASDLDRLLAVELKPPSAILVPSRDGTGTNALLRTPPTAFPSRFGPESLRLHQAEAQQRQVSVLIEENPRLALDLDTVQDLLLFLEAGDEKLVSYRLVSGWFGEEAGLRGIR